jgi:hypothetical protein
MSAFEHPPLPPVKEDEEIPSEEQELEELEDDLESEQ